MTVASPKKVNASGYYAEEEENMPTASRMLVRRGKERGEEREKGRETQTEREEGRDRTREEC